MSNERVGRIDVAMARLEKLAADADRAQGRLSRPDPDTAERWDSGQIWAHVAEMVPYWTSQARGIVAVHDRGEKPAPFGRTKDDPNRLARIESGRKAAMPLILSGLQQSFADLRTFCDDLPDSSWAAAGRHVLRGEMTVAQIVDALILDHVDEHAAEIERMETEE